MDKTLRSYNPRTQEVLGEVPLLGPEEIRERVRAAQRAFPAWSRLPVAERVEMLRRVRDHLLEHSREIAKLISLEQGKPVAEALGSDILPAVEIANTFMDRLPYLLGEHSIPLRVLKGLKRSVIQPRALGVVAVVSPWNFPFSIPMSGILFALMTGNTVVLKPASEVPLISQRIARIFDEIGLPEGVFNLAIARGRDVGDTLFSPPIAKVVFTGSTATGIEIQRMCAQHLIPTVLELGGKDPMIVLADADLKLAAKGAVWGAFNNTGQVCASVERVYVDRRVYREFLLRVEEETRKLRLGVPPVEEYDIGPLISESQLNTVKDHVRDAVERGAQVVVGGRGPYNGATGWFYEPTVLIQVDHSMKVMTEETFGPVMPIMAFDTEEEAIALANDSPYGLTASVWSRDLDHAKEVARWVEAGTVTINDHAYTYGLVETPWKGIKHSGMGTSHGDEGVREFLFDQHLNMDQVPFLRRRMWWFPYGRDLSDFLEALIQVVSHPSHLGSFLAGVVRKKEWRSSVFGR